MSNEYTAGQAVRFTKEDQWEGLKVYPGTEATYVRPSDADSMAHLNVDGKPFLAWVDHFEPVAPSAKDVLDELVDSLSHALGERLPPEFLAYISAHTPQRDRRVWVRDLLGHSQPGLTRSPLQILKLEA